ncbi:MAG: type II toxin-antitoxin system RelE/ParE family toxin [Cyclobacteriaceae bacterium]|nr:type II toxin-antitoxin system RelE/ParE family toxin [Cyclobacteriaceae bacterium]
MTVEIIPKKFFKHIEDGIYEIRIKSGSNIYRLFSFFDEGKLVILLHGFTKKSQKLPRKEIDRALRLRREYYESK